mgnify:CR=1 FL=1
MPWCPKCKVEYREGFRECSDCKSELINELEQDENAPKSGQEDMEVLVGDDTNDTITFLVNAKDEIEFSIIESKLKQAAIPVLKKYKESGGYLTIYMGNTPFGIDVYVPSKLLKIAREIIRPYGSVDNNCEYITESIDCGINGNINEAASEITDVTSEQEFPDELLEKMAENYNRKKKNKAWVTLLFFMSGIILLLVIISWLLRRK